MKREGGEVEGRENEVHKEKGATDYLPKDVCRRGNFWLLVLLLLKN